METRCYIKPPVERMRFVALEAMTGGGTTGVRVITSLDGVNFTRPAGKIEFQPARSARRGARVAFAGETNFTALNPCRAQGGVVPTMCVSRYGGVRVSSSPLGNVAVGTAPTPYLFPTSTGFEQGRNACQAPATQLRGYGQSTSGLLWEPADASPPLGGAPFATLNGAVFASQGVRKAGDQVWTPYPAELFAPGPCRAVFGGGQPFLREGRVYFGPYRFNPVAGSPYAEAFTAFASTTDGVDYLVHPPLAGALPSSAMEVVGTAGAYLGRVPATSTLYASDDFHTWRTVSSPAGVQQLAAGFGVFVVTASSVGTVLSPQPFAYTATVPGVWTPVVVTYNEAPRAAWSHLYALVEEGEV